MAALLELDDVHTYYGNVHALKGLTLEVDEGEVVALLGANGAGKSTTLRTIVGLERPRSGDIRLAASSIVGIAPHKITGQRVALVPEGRHIFPNLTVRENLLMGAYADPDADRMRKTEATVYELFPVLSDRRNQLGTSLSGGEQQMLAIGRAMMSHPRLLLLDEPSLGLAPLIVRDIFKVIQQLADERGVTILLVEQNARQALRVSSRAYVLEVGRLVHQGTAEELVRDERIQHVYLGVK